jgi:hypothetical protein
MNWLDERELQLHISILGWLHIVVNALFLVLAVFAFILLPTFGAISGDPEGAVVLGVLGTAFGLLMVILGLPGMLAGYGLLKHKPWARVLALVLGVLGLVNFPVGTAIGIYTLIVLTQHAASEYFAPQQPA